MSTNVAYLITSTGVLLFIDGQQLTVANDHPNLAKIKQAIADKDYDAVLPLIDLRSTVKSWLSKNPDFILSGDRVSYKGTPFSQEVTAKVLSMIDAGHDAEPLFNFLAKTRENPSFAAQNELLLFCVANGFMIHIDGDVLAYKSVRGDYTDIHSGKFRNAVGDVVTMERGAVDDNRHQTCSTGLHFAAYNYASTWAGAIDGVDRRLMVMKIHPRDVVSIPADYHNQKGRCCRYEVIAELTNGTALPVKEVYTDTDISGLRVDLAAVQKEIDRKGVVLERWLKEQDDVEDRIEIVQNAGGDSSKLVEKSELLDRKIARISSEIADLTDTLDA